MRDRTAQGRLRSGVDAPVGHADAVPVGQTPGHRDVHDRVAESYLQAPAIGDGQPRSGGDSHDGQPDDDRDRRALTTVV